jgi:hypothetical protein
VVVGAWEELEQSKSRSRSVSEWDDSRYRVEIGKMFGDDPRCRVEIGKMFGAGMFAGSRRLAVFVVVFLG